MYTIYSRKALVFAGILLVALGFALGYWFKDQDGVDNESTPTPTPSVSQSPTPSATPRPTPSLVTIRLTAQGPQPRSITIRKGDSVSFINDDSRAYWLVSDPHPAHTDCPGLDSRRGLATGESYTLTFPAARTCSFHNELDPYAVGGTIIIQ
jgi:plastocyanin